MARYIWSCQAVPASFQMAQVQHMVHLQCWVVRPASQSELLTPEIGFDGACFYLPKARLPHGHLHNSSVCVTGVLIPLPAKSPLFSHVLCTERVSREVLPQHCLSNLSVHPLSTCLWQLQDDGSGCNFVLIGRPLSAGALFLDLRRCLFVCAQFHHLASRMTASWGNWLLPLLHSLRRSSCWGCHTLCVAHDWGRPGPEYSHRPRPRRNFTITSFSMIEVVSKITASVEVVFSGGQEGQSSGRISRTLQA